MCSSAFNNIWVAKSGLHTITLPQVGGLINTPLWFSTGANSKTTLDLIYSEVADFI